MTNKCPITAVDGFGPATDCRNTFDFSLLFEESILTIGPAAAFTLVTVFLYLRPLLEADRKIAWTWQLHAKQAAWTVLVLLNAALIGVTAHADTPKTSLSVSACLIVAFAHVWLAVLSHFAHIRSIRPSSPITLYLALTLPFDIARCRTLWNLESGETVAGIMTAAVVIKGVLLVLEALEKRSILLEPFRPLPREATVGAFNQWFCWWMNPLLLFGWRRMHSLDTLWEVDLDLAADEEKSGLFERWNECECAK
jgi:ATP-binding cassette, subfamily C (CFTR/MRP), member 1